MTTELHIRPARLGDVPSLPDIERSAGGAFRSYPALSWIAGDSVMSEAAHQRWIAEGTSWVAEEDDGPLGFLAAETVGDALHIWEIAVRLDKQGRGVGSRLIEHAADHARAAGLRELTLTTFRDVPWNEPFYQRIGFATLSGDEIGDRLSAIMARESAAGLPAERRCAMRRTLRAPVES